MARRIRQTINLSVKCLFLFIFYFFQLWPHAKRAFGAGSRWKRCLEAGGDIFTRDTDMCVFSTERRHVCCWKWLCAVRREGVWMGRTEKNTDGFCSQRLQRYKTTSTIKKPLNLNRQKILSTEEYLVQLCIVTSSVTKIRMQYWNVSIEN